MKIAILHFHLRAGGVTRVIELAYSALSKEGHEVIIISGEPAPMGCHIPKGSVFVVSELAYGISTENVEDLCQNVEAIFRRCWGQWADAMHVHNHSLGKNFALPLAVAKWGKEGRAMLLQLHDFAENGRSINYQKLIALCGGGNAEMLSHFLYPVAPHIRYALLNSHDHDLFKEFLPYDWSIYLPNPVELLPGNDAFNATQVSADRLIVYPTRGIRRKNIGEAIFWAARAEKGSHYLITSAPQTKRDLDFYQRWACFSTDHQLPVTFNAIAKYGRPIGDFLRGADLCLTTSIAEGFGMAFLEPWAAGSNLAGRNLPLITQDFTACGLRFENLYERMDIPAGIFSTGEVEEMVSYYVENTLRSYGVPLNLEAIEQAINTVCHEERVDFGRLDEELQQKVIEALLYGKISRTDITPKQLRHANTSIAANGKIVRERFNLTEYGQQLIKIYQDVADSSRSAPTFLKAKPILMKFLNFSNFYALRLCFFNEAHKL